MFREIKVNDMNIRCILGIQIIEISSILIIISFTTYHNTISLSDVCLMFSLRYESAVRVITKFCQNSDIHKAVANLL